MLSAKDNEFISRTGPGTPMGEWLRRFWTPLMLSSELEADGEPKEVRMYSEDLVAYRDSDGKVGVIDALCPHRQAPLVLARNEESGLRCIYHGWKFDTNGHCVDMPSEPSDSVFKDKVRAGYYRAAEAAGVIWVYMGPKDLQPELPQMEWMRVADDWRNVHKFNAEGNWIQAFEGDVDSPHTGFLHRTLRERNDITNPDPNVRYRALDKAPRWLIQPTNYGIMVAARRNAEADSYFWRINQVFWPYYTFVAGPVDKSSGLAHIWVPTDDTHTDVWSIQWRTQRPMTEQERAAMLGGVRQPHVATYDPTTGGLRANKANHFFQDREEQRTETFSGIPGTREQDAAMTIGMGPIVDRTKEHLGTSDTAVIALRRLLIKAGRDLQNGIEPYAASHGDAYKKRAWSAVLQRNDDFINDPEAKALHESPI